MNHGSSAPRSEFTVRLKFRPVDSSFYDLFSEAANHLVVGAQLLSEMLSDGSSKAVTSVTCPFWIVTATWTGP